MTLGNGLDRGLCGGPHLQVGLLTSISARHLCLLMSSSPVFLSRQSFKDVTTDPSLPDPTDTSASPDSSPQQSEFHQTQERLFLATLGLSVVIAGGVALTYTPSIAANYLLGAIGGVVYLRMLGRSVARLGKGSDRLGVARLAVFVGLILLATQLDSLQVLPIFFGFLSYKLTLLLYLLQLLTRPSRSRSR